MTDDTLSAFVTTAKERGLDDASLVALLRQQGWREQDVYSALSAYYARTLDLEVPSRGGASENARDAFYHLVAFATLGAWLIGLIDLVDVLIDRRIPPVGTAGFASLPSAHDLAWHIATIVVAFPIFIWVNVLIAREAAVRPESLQSGVRKWLTYVALVVAAAVLLGDATWLLASFLSGSATEAFVLKSLFIIVATGATFAYYLGGVSATALPPWRNRLYAGVAALAVFAAIAEGFGPLGSPAHEQALASDAALLRHLDSLARDANDDRTTPGAQAVPAKLASAEPGEYLPLDRNRYRLCATFQSASQPDEKPAWQHPAGHACFTFDARRAPDDPTVRY